ncbi:hypothetical protein ASPVEDRAFT_71799 [Aspergillus versicolor CBS 583.65]|uniref:Ecp2 effector protein domain-containing protein n=1 Tax=Aspergillus versicolor CBS 583.65 TaxID=1036611 RepID=A0A1L9PJS7_ASPVE|nr:uncharacterized protein ASPVEDRAFT_71799 [Aspergillus versicolor CBS 583.65]OJJ01787.1 hypothetical protein ASPVEDRAFT_71799 [Aspergillus versicolor CBS 583.65]
MKAATVLSALAITTGAAAAGVNCAGEPYAPIGNIKNCIKYLKDKGTAQCKVGGGNGGFCKDGSAVILGHGTTQTNCQNVAAAAEAILGKCTTSNGYAGGRSTIGGNDSVYITVKKA